MKMFSRFSLVFLLSFPFFGKSFADAGENCPIDIVSEFSEQENWRTADVIEGADGSAWQRATLTSPASILELKEGENTVITGVAEVSVPVQILIFSPDTDELGHLKKPGPGNCFDVGESNTSGFFRFSINARMIWGALDGKIALDAYYKMNVPWKEVEKYNRSQSLQTFYIGSSQPSRIFTVKGESVQSEESCSVICESSETIRAVSFDSGSLNPALLGNNFDAVGNKKITIGRMPGPHTFYVDVDGKTPDQGDWNILQRILHKSLGMEITKRVLLVNENSNGVSPGLSEISAVELIRAEGGEGDYSARTRELAQNIKTILVSRDFDKREKAAQKIDFLAGSENEQSFFRSSLVREVLVPDVSTEETWADDFVELMRFWSGKTVQNNCLMQDDAEIWRNFVESNTEMSGNLCSLMFINGQSPRILIHSKEEITLRPDFQNTKIVSAETPFENGEKWILPQGMKKAMYYRYDFLTPFSPDYSPDSCITQNTLSEYIDAVSKSFSLLPEEKEVLAIELKNEIPRHSLPFSLRMAEPENIKQRFKWLDNNKPLQLLQLFFQVQDSPCHPHIAPPPQKFQSELRDGFETGMLE